jgi:hypothetical protein
MSIKEVDLTAALGDYLSLTSYKDQVLIDTLPVINVNEALFCTAIDNLIRNGLKYNDSGTKLVRIYIEDNYICVEDNGRGLTNEEFIELMDKLSEIMLKQGEPFRARAYQKAQETIMSYKDDIYSPDQLKGLPGIGPTIMEKLNEYVRTGTLQILEREKFLKDERKYMGHDAKQSLYGNELAAHEARRLKYAKSQKELKEAVQKLLGNK